MKKKWRGSFQYNTGEERREELLKGGKKIFQIKEMKRACLLRRQRRRGLFLNRRRWR